MTQTTRHQIRHSLALTYTSLMWDEMLGSINHIPVCGRHDVRRPVRTVIDLDVAA